MKKLSDWVYGILDVVKIILFFVGLALGIGAFIGVGLWAWTIIMRMLGIEVKP